MYQKKEDWNNATFVLHLLPKVPGSQSCKYNNWDHGILMLFVCLFVCFVICYFMNSVAFCAFCSNPCCAFVSLLSFAGFR